MHKYCHVARHNSHCRVAAEKQYKDLSTECELYFDHLSTCSFSEQDKTSKLDSNFLLSVKLECTEPFAGLSKHSTPTPPPLTFKNVSYPITYAG